MNIFCYGKNKNKISHRVTQEKSDEYRNSLIEKIRKEMIENPLSSLNDVSNAIGCSTNTISSYYKKIRKTKEWKDRLRLYCEKE